MMKLKLKVIEGRYQVARFKESSEWPIEQLKEGFVSLTRTEDELSIVCNEAILLKADQVEKGWRMLKVVGPLDFGLVGILAKLTTLMAEGEISIFALSTYDTDYLLIKEEHISKAIKLLKQNNYEVIE